MAFTQDELQQLKEVVQVAVDESISAAVLPLIEGIHDQLEAMNEKIDLNSEKIDRNSEKIDRNSEKIDRNAEKIDRNSKKIDENTLMQQEQHEESLRVIGQQTQYKVSAQKHRHLETRVGRIEQHLGMAA